MKEFSKAWKTSTQPRKQRKYRYNAPMHLRRNMMSAHLEKTLRREYGTRSIGIKKDDEVKIMRGSFSGTRGKITRVDMKALKVYVDNAKRKKVSGQEVEAAIDPSNILITKLNFEDKNRRKFLKRKGGKTTPEGRHAAAEVKEKK